MRYSLLLLITIMIHFPAFAGDEDMNPTAYSVFDPVTGYMIPVEDMPPQQHIPATQESMQTQIDTPAPQTTSMSQPMTSQNTTAEEQNRSPMWMYLVSIALILGGFAAWVRNKGKISSSNLD